MDTSNTQEQGETRLPIQDSRNDEFVIQMRVLEFKEWGKWNDIVICETEKSIREFFVEHDMGNPRPVLEYRILHRTTTVTEFNIT